VGVGVGIRIRILSRPELCVSIDVLTTACGSCCAARGVDKRAQRSVVAVYSTPPVGELSRPRSFQRRAVPVVKRKGAAK
jgi:hypothetical protein